MRPIDADALGGELRDAIEECTDRRPGVAAGIDFAARIAEDAPTVDPVKHGRWIDTEDADPGQPLFRCSACRTMMWHKFKSAYCPFCGAKMDKDEEKTK